MQNMHTPINITFPFLWIYGKSSISQNHKIIDPTGETSFKKWFQQLTTELKTTSAMGNYNLHVSQFSDIVYKVLKFFILPEFTQTTF